MALFFPKSNALFLHLPKSGGTFIRSAAHELGVNCWETGPYHGNLFDFDASFLSDKFIFSFVRNPLTWFQSFWCCPFHRKRIEQRRQNLDVKIVQESEAEDLDAVSWEEAENFVQWAERVVQEYPSWLSNYYDKFTRNINFVGKQEFLVYDFVQVMNILKEEFDENRVQKIHIQNPSSRWYRNRCRYSPRLLDKFLKSEESAIKRFSYKINKSDFLAATFL